ADFLERAADFRPRAWAVEHISCHRSLPKVNEALRTSAESEGRPWTTDIAPFCWRPLATLIRPEDADRLRPAGEELMARFPDLFGQAMWSSLRTESTAPRSAPAAPAATAGEGDANRLLPGLVSGDG
ncbi:MAG: hypothetical protein J2P46_21405, partial [Zavarzinella sp.]|nr:hypothetical protein [Zavarzinella sp.]